jgi:hypothetical protein
MKRAFTTTSAVLAVALLVAAPAGGHGRTGTARGYVSTVAAVEPNVLGLGAFVVGGDDRLLLRNLSGKEIVILGYDGEPYLRFTPRGVFENVRSPATFLNRTRFAERPPPASADPTAAPEWRRVAGGVTYQWHDHRIHWMRRTPPRAVAAAPRRRQAIRAWRVPGTVEGRRFAVTGFLGYDPPPLEATAHPVDDGDPPWVVPAAVGGGLLALLALVVRARRNKGT